MNEGENEMAKVMKNITIISFLLFVVFLILYYFTSVDLCEALAITFGTILYHFVMRLAVGFLFNTFMKNRADYNKKWYRLCLWENKLYDLLKVKTWKNKMPTYNPDLFNYRKHSWEEIAQAMCQAELVHETIIVLSFAPITASIWFGAFWVFLSTSVAGACLDLTFVIIQRYNRSRVIKMIERKHI